MVASGEGTETAEGMPALVVARAILPKAEVVETLVMARPTVWKDMAIGLVGVA